MKNNKLYFFFKHSAFLLFVLVFVSCKENPYPDFTPKRHGIYMKLITIGDNDKKARPGDYITVDISYQTMNDSAFFSGRRKFQMSAPSYPGSIDECFALLQEGDEGVFIINAFNFFEKTLETTLPSFIGENEKMKVQIKMVEIQTEKEYLKEKTSFLKWVEDFGEYEKVVLKQFLEDEKISSAPTKTGLYFLPLVQGNGRKVEVGDTVVVHYEGRFLNGKFFDSTKKRNEPFEFVYGQKWQVILGLEEAIGMMEELQKVLVILPSDIAFGTKGSSTGIIPPFTSLIYEVELIQVRKAKN